MLNSKYITFALFMGFLFAFPAWNNPSLAATEKEECEEKDGKYWDEDDEECKKKRARSRCSKNTDKYSSACEKAREAIVDAKDRRKIAQAADLATATTIGIINANNFRPYDEKASIRQQKTALTVTGISMAAKVANNLWSVRELDKAAEEAERESTKVEGLRENYNQARSRARQANSNSIVNAAFDEHLDESETMNELYRKSAQTAHGSIPLTEKKHTNFVGALSTDAKEIINKGGDSVSAFGRNATRARDQLNSARRAAENASDGSMAETLLNSVVLATIPIGLSSLNRLEKSLEPVPLSSEIEFGERRTVASTAPGDDFISLGDLGGDDRYDGSGIPAGARRGIEAKNSFPTIEPDKSAANNQGFGAGVAGAPGGGGLAGGANADPNSNDNNDFGYTGSGKIDYRPSSGAKGLNSGFSNAPSKASAMQEALKSLLGGKGEKDKNSLSFGENKDRTLASRSGTNSATDIGEKNGRTIFQRVQSAYERAQLSGSI